MKSILCSHLLLVAALFACSGSENTEPATENQTSSVKDSEIEEADGPTIISKSYNLYHNAIDDNLILEWYSVSLFSSGTVNGGDFLGEWSIEPKIDGQLKVIAQNKLSFIPSDPLPPATDFTFTISKIKDFEDDEREWIPETPALWSQKITTRAFKVQGVSFGKVERNKKRASILLRTSHPVDLEDVKNNTRIKFNGNNLPYQASLRDDGQIELKIKNTDLVGQELEVSVDPLTYATGQPFASEPFNWVGKIGAWEPIKLYGPFVDETASGFTVEYVCDDTSVKRRSWYWNSNFSFDERISRRCTIDTEQLRNSIEIDPPVRNLQVYPRERGFALVADFNQGAHQITIPAGVSTQDGGGLLETNIETISIPQRSPSLRFHSLGRYLPVDGWTNVHFQHRNIDKINVEVREIKKSNLHHWAQDGNEKIQQSEGTLLLTKEVQVSGDVDAMVRGSLNLKDLIPNRSAGLYQVKLKDPSSNAVSQLTVQVTDMNIVTKRFEESNGTEQILSWILNTRTNVAMQNVEVSLMSASGGVTDSCTTDVNGLCSFSVAKDEKNNTAFALYAERTAVDGQPELSYLVFDSLSIDLGLYDASGVVGSNKTYRIAAHSDRGAYRPGDTVQLFAFIRDDNNRSPKSGLPVHLTIEDGRGQTVKETTINVNDAGLLTYTLNLAEYANTGTWSVKWTVKGGKDKDTLGEQGYSFKVENLMPERLSVKSSFTNKDQLGGAELSGTVSARYLFGKTAEGAKYTVRCDVQSTPFAPKNNSNYTYGSATAFEGFYLGTYTNTLDEDGQGTFICPNPERLKGLPGMATVVASIDVMESGSGRSTKRSTRSKVHPTEQYIGLQIGINPDEVKPNVEYPVGGIVVDWQGTRSKQVAAVDVQISEVDVAYNWYYNEDAGEYEYSINRFELPLQRNTIPVNNGLFQTSITGQRDISEYRIRAQAGNSVTFLDLSRDYNYWYSDSYARIQTPDPFRPDNLDIQTPSAMNLKETVTATTLAPYTGKILWTVENDDIIRQEWMTVEKAGEISWSFSLAGQPFQNTVYVTALLVKDAHSDSEVAYMPARAFGAQPIKVRSKQFTHSLNLSVPKEVRANSSMKVDLDFGGSVEPETVALVAVVDEGLLSLTNFQTPDPSDALFPKLPLQVSTAETIGWGISSPSLNSAKAGGGDGDDGNARRKAKVVKPVALWSGLVKVPKSGKVSVPFDIPQYSGAVRVMAWSSSSSKFASTDSQVLVRDPLTMQATLPRFLTEGDIFDVPVSLTNLSGKDQTVTVQLSASSQVPIGRTEAVTTNSIALLGKNTTTVTIKADETKDTIVVFQGKALAESGFATFVVEATNKDGSLRSEEKLEVPFGSKKPTEREFQKIHLKELLGNNLSGTVDLNSYVSGWSVEDTTIWATNNPYSESLVRVRDLIRYPYGCIEQTSSSLRPLLSAASILQNIDPAAIQAKPIDKMVQAGVERLASMQTNDGGLGYWPGAYNSHPWGTAYATHVLLDAKANGYPVMDSLLEETTQYLLSVVNGNFDYGYYSYYMQSTKPYAHYILARVGKGKPVAIRELLKNQQSLGSYESEYMLKTALYLSGDRTYEAELKSLTKVGTLRDDYDHWSFRSQLRTKGMILALHQEMFGSSESSGEALAQNIHSSILAYKTRYISTQSLGWSTYALAQRVLTDSSWKAPTLTKNGKQLKTAQESNNNSSWAVWDSERKGDTLELKGSGTDGYIILATQGVRSNGTYKYGDSGLKISREYRNMDGSSFNPETHSLGDEVVVVLTLTNIMNDEINEIAVVDRIPAGWEIQNPNLSEFAGNLSDFGNGNMWASEYTSIRDNQIEIFGDLERGATRTFVYTVRGTTSGTFTIPPVSAEAMYNDQIWSRHKGMIIQIRGQWDGKRI